ncbi:pyrimidine dimer DNA glycosylase/endonuclease V [Microbacterium marinilacus]|uniref:Pyrimidine dimer DNA glycosylase/endonuclease V n=2 Tax=Microbacterium marinilacus TaxID=415209 RepID=A0ABP7BII9_9MICO
MWSLHPSLLDRQGLTAVWREGLLAQAVLLGRTRGYKAHPQLARFRDHDDPVGAVGAYLSAVAAEASRRGYRFDVARIDAPDGALAPIAVTSGQLEFEWRHLLAKLAERSPEVHTRLVGVSPEAHPMFEVVPGPVEAWERGVSPTGRA